MGVSFKVSRTGRRYQPKPSDNYSAEDESLDDGVAASTKADVKLTGEAGEKRATAEISEAEASFRLSLFPDGYTVKKYEENDSGRQAPIEIPKFLHPYNRASETLFSAIESGLLPGDILDDIPCKFINGTVICEVRDYRKCSPENPNAASGDVSPIINIVRLRMSLENVVKDIPAISDSNWTYGDLMEVESRIVKALQPELCLDPFPKLAKLADNPVPTKLNFELRSMRRKRLGQIPEVSLYSNNIQGKRVFIDRASENSRPGDSGSLMQQQPGFVNMSSQNNISSAMLPQRSNSFGSDGSLLMSPLLSQQSKYQIGPASPRLMKDQRSGVFSNAAVASPGGHDRAIPFSSNSAPIASVHGKRDQPDWQSSPLINKKARLTPGGVGGNPQHMGPQMDNLQCSDAQWKNSLLQQQQQQQQTIGRGVQFANNGMQKLPQQIFDGGVTQEGSSMSFSMGQQQGIGYNLKEEPIEMERLDRPEHSRMHMSQSYFSSNTDPYLSRVQQRMHPLFMRSGVSQTPRNNLDQPLDNNLRNEEKIKLVQSPRISAGGLPQSPLSSKSGDFSSGSIGHQFGPAATSGFNQNDKSVVTSVPPVVGGNPSFTSSANETMQRQNQTQAAGKRRTNSRSKTPTMGGVGSPASVSNMSVPINANSPSVGNQPFGDQPMLERFSKIEMVTMRYQLNHKKNKADQLRIGRAKKFSPQLVAAAVSNPNFDNSKDETCEMPLSKSLVGGNMNVCKVRIMNIVQTERIIQGNNLHIVPKARTRFIMSERPNDGAVAFHIGEIGDAEYLAAEDCLPTLPNTDIADRLGAQFYSLMKREGYEVEDNVQLKPAVRTDPAPSDIPGIPLGSPSADVQKFQVGISVPQPNDFAKPSMSINASFNAPQQNMQNRRVLPPSNAQQIQNSQAQGSGISVQSRPRQPEQVPPMQQQQQNPQFQRSQVMLPASSVQHMSQNPNNMPMGPNMTNKPSPLQLQPLQQQQQQQAQMQRRISGLGSVPMGSIGNNMVDLGGLNNVMGIGGVRDVTSGPGISGPMGPFSGLGNVNQSNPIIASNLANALRSGTLTPAQAAFVKRLVQNRSNIMGGAQSSLAGMTGAREMHPGISGLSMLGPALNRDNINQMQRTAMGQMGPHKMMPGMSMYANQTQQQQQSQQHQQIQMPQQRQQSPMQQQQQQQQQIQMQTLQETASPLQSVVTPLTVGSPSTSSMGGLSQTNQQPQQQQMQQQASPQQMGERTPMSPQQMGQRTPMSPQMSSGVLQQTAAANPEASPASPQLSTQTMGSVGSITNSSKDAQAVDKSNADNNNNA